MPGSAAPCLRKYPLLQMINPCVIVGDTVSDQTNHVTKQLVDINYSNNGSCTFILQEKSSQVNRAHHYKE